MGLFRRKPPGTELEVLQGPVKPVQPEPEPEPIPDTEMVWRCRCGSMGIHRESLEAHVGKFRKGRMCEAGDIRVYVPAVEQEYEAKAAENAVSGIWVVVKMPEETPEGEIDIPDTTDLTVFGKRTIRELWTSVVIEADSGTQAITFWYEAQVAKFGKNSTETEREEANGRYVAIDFFTGHRAEALIQSDWRAKVEIAEGSHQ